MDGEAGWWTTSGNIGLPPLARAMGVGRQQHKHALDVAKKEVYTAVMTAQESKLQEFTADLHIFKVNLVGRTASGLLNRWLGREEMLSACAV